CRAGSQVAHKDVAEATRTIGDQVRRETLERHNASVGADGGPGGGAVAAAGAGAVDAGQSGRAGFEVAHKDVARVVRIIGNQVAGETLECHKTSVGADDG